MKYLVLIIILATVAYYGYPEAKEAVAAKKTEFVAADVQKLNDYSSNSIMLGITGQGTKGYSKLNAWKWYERQRLVNSGMPDMTHLIYRDGVWKMGNPPQDGAGLLSVINPHFTVSAGEFLKDKGYETIADAKSALGPLDAWAQDQGSVSFVGYIYNNYSGGVIRPLKEEEADLVMDALVNMPEDALPFIKSYPQLLTDDQMITVSSLLTDGLKGEYGPSYPTGLTQGALNSIVAAASKRDGDAWKKLNLSAINETGLNLSGAKIAKINLPIERISKASSFAGADFTGVDLKGFDPSRKSLKGAKLPEDSNSPRLFRWTTGITPSPGTIWLDGSRPWG